MGSVCDKTCADCRFSGKASTYRMCYYIFIIGHSRGCPPGEGCTRHETRKEHLYREKHDKIMRYNSARQDMIAQRKEYENQTVTKLHAKGMNDEYIARQLGVSAAMVGVIRRRLKLPANKYIPNRLDPEEDARRMALWKQGLSDPEIARRVGTKTTPIRSWRIRRGLPANCPPPGTKKEDWKKC